MIAIFKAERDKFAFMIPDILRRTGFKLILIILVALASSYSYSQPPTNLQYRNMPQDLRLLYAAAFGDTSIIGPLLLVGTDINVQADNGATPLAYAVSFLQIISTAYLLEAGADPNIPNLRKETPLHLAVFNQDIKISELLIRYGANLNARDLHGATPLHYEIGRASCRERV